MSIEKRLQRIELDIANGLKNKAVNKLRVLINEYPNELYLRDTLAKLFYEAGFYDEAGKYWVLSEPLNEEMKFCIDLHQKSVNHSGRAILQDITFRGDIHLVNLYAQNKMKALKEDSKKKTNHIPLFKAKDKYEVKTRTSQVKQMIAKYAFITIIIACVALWIIGWVTVIRWIF